MNTLARLSVLSAFGAYLSALVFLACFFHSLPDSDAAKQQGFILTLLDPFVSITAFIVSSIVAALFLPVVVFSLRNKAILGPSIVIGTATLLTIITLTPSNPKNGFLTSIGIAFITIVLCKYLPFRTKP